MLLWAEIEVGDAGRIAVCAMGLHILEAFSLERGPVCGGVLGVRNRIRYSTGSCTSEVLYSIRSYTEQILVINNEWTSGHCGES